MKASSHSSRSSPLTKRCEASLLQSLALIHSKPSGDMATSRRNSMNDHKVRRGSSCRELLSRKSDGAAGKTQGLRRRNTVDHGLAMPASQNCSLRLECNHCTPSFEKDRLKTAEVTSRDKKAISPKESRPAPYGRQASSRDTNYHRVSNYTVASLPNDSVKSPPTDITANNVTCVQGTRHKWPPPLPPRPTNDSKSTNLSSIFHSPHTKLPFLTVPTSSRPHPVQHSEIEMEHANNQDLDVADLPAATAHPSPSRKRYPKNKFQGFRKDYALGQVARSSSHMVMESSSTEAANKVSQLKTHDFAFIKRTNDSWTYAILAFRSVDESQEEYMLFVLTSSGSTKTIKKPQWAEFIRCVAVEEDCVEDVKMGNYDGGSAKLVDIAVAYRRQLRDTWVPESILLEKNDEECSSISLDSY